MTKNHYIVIPEHFALAHIQRDMAAKYFEVKSIKL